MGPPICHTMVKSLISKGLLCVLWCLWHIVRAKESQTVLTVVVIWKSGRTYLFSCQELSNIGYILLELDM